MKVEVRTRGIPELKVELSRLNVAVAGRLARNAVMAGVRVAARHARLQAFGVDPCEIGQMPLY